VKIVDFGVAKLTALEGPAARSAGLTATGTMVGTPYYMSPEQAFGEKDIDARSDLWAVGVILYECLTGRRPTEADNMGQVLKLLAHMTFPPIERVAPDIEPRIASLVGRLLCERERRIGSAAEVRRELLSIVADPSRAPDLPHVVVSAGMSFEDSRKEALSTTTSAATTLRRTSAPQQRWPAAFGVVIAIGAAIGLAALLSRNPSRSSVAPPASAAEPPIVAASVVHSAAASSPSSSTTADAVPLPATAPRTAGSPRTSSSVPRQVASASASGAGHGAGPADPTKLMTVPPF